MPPLTPAQRRVLTATARVAGLAALVACAPKQTATAPSAADSPRAEVPSSEPSAPPASDALTVDAEPLTVETCEATTSEALAGVQFGERDLEVSDEVEQCCTLLLDAYEKGMTSGGVADFDARWGCCAISGNEPLMACTPWGPPAPPAMV